MRRRFWILTLLSCSLLGSGCQCYRVTNWYGNAIDTISDSKLKLDPLYVPGLDVSRTGMPDWQRFGANRFLCPCANGIARRNKRPVYYPATYRLKYWQTQSQAQTPAGDDPSLNMPVPPEPSPAADPAEIPEIAPPPMPIDATP